MVVGVINIAGGGEPQEPIDLNGYWRLCIRETEADDWEYEDPWYLRQL
jgi:hypothetical protein